MIFLFCLCNEKKFDVCFFYIQKMNKDERYFAFIIISLIFLLILLAVSIRYKIVSLGLISALLMVASFMALFRKIKREDQVRSEMNEI